MLGISPVYSESRPFAWFVEYYGLKLGFLGLYYSILILSLKLNPFHHDSHANLFSDRYLPESD
ncbi:hypothetical protein BDW62DRAFT_16 [Aspergillus aurantiobrunneus]